MVNLQISVHKRSSERAVWKVHPDKDRIPCADRRSNVNIRHATHGVYQHGRVGHQRQTTAEDIEID